MPQTPQNAPAPQAAKPKPPEPPPALQEGAIATMDVAGIVKILNDAGSSEFQKAKACQRAGELGAQEAIPALAALLTQEHLSTYARYGLEPIADPAVDETLRAALSKLKGDLLIGVINSIGKRKDGKAVPALSKMIYGSDVEVARAAAAALGQIGNPVCAAELQGALVKTSGTVRTAVADAALVCSEQLLIAGNRPRALELYTFLSNPNVPKPVRLAAMNSIIREESRPQGQR